MRISNEACYSPSPRTVGAIISPLFLSLGFPGGEDAKTNGRRGLPKANPEPRFTRVGDEDIATS
ncbi:hypothetical protein M408DRAFT_284525 [Serendipita vermifera MAFF 305830]|uniref:Uncharacterized protein n=1 Tax=Serendipita vermifera MAFF 305830 TaxID=933852 RepID=A0A0C3BE01_SERVB|nr:hypothetical protein M408DRAFT_284525 [Serendipita vermifera MAFF 305830]